jgi:hypothetical protein
MLSLVLVLSFVLDLVKLLMPRSRGRLLFSADALRLAKRLQGATVSQHTGAVSMTV